MNYQDRLRDVMYKLANRLDIERGARGSSASNSGKRSTGCTGKFAYSSCPTLQRGLDVVDCVAMSTWRCQVTRRIIHQAGERRIDPGRHSYYHRKQQQFVVEKLARALAISVPEDLRVIR
jgi:hypothetical protein